MSVYRNGVLVYILLIRRIIETGNAIEKYHARVYQGIMARLSKVGVVVSLPLVPEP